MQSRPMLKNPLGLLVVMTIVVVSLSQSWRQPPPNWRNRSNKRFSTHRQGHAHVTARGRQLKILVTQCKSLCFPQRVTHLSSKDRTIIKIALIAGPAGPRHTCIGTGSHILLHPASLDLVPAASNSEAQVRATSTTTIIIIIIHACPLCIIWIAVEEVWG